MKKLKKQKVRGEKCETNWEIYEFIYRRSRGRKGN